MKQLVFSVTKDDFDVQTFRSGGHGGQHQNKTESGVRIVHRESGAVGESRTERSQHQNKKYAFRRLVETDKFKKWLRIQASVRCGTMKTEEQLMEEVKNMIQNKYLKLEVKENGKWVPKEIEGSTENGDGRTSGNV